MQYIAVSVRIIKLFKSPYPRLIYFSLNNIVTQTFSLLSIQNYERKMSSEVNITKLFFFVLSGLVSRLLRILLILFINLFGRGNKIHEFVFLLSMYMIINLSHSNLLSQSKKVTQQNNFYTKHKKR